MPTQLPETRVLQPVENTQITGVYSAVWIFFPGAPSGPRRQETNDERSDAVIPLRGGRRSEGLRAYLPSWLPRGWDGALVVARTGVPSGCLKGKLFVTNML